MYPSCLHNLVALRLVLLAVQQDKLRNSVPAPFLHCYCAAVSLSQHKFTWVDHEQGGYKTADRGAIG